MELPTEDNPVTVIEGDCLEVLRALPDACVDAVITDPPYGTGGWRRSSSGLGSSPVASLVREDWDAGDVDWVSEAARTARAVATFWMQSRTLQLLSAAVEAGLTKHRALYWHKPDPKPQCAGRVRWSVEPIWVLSPDGFQLYGGTDWCERSAVRMNRDDEAAGHPYQKPLSVMRWLVSKFPKDALILDPFAGSGTTGIAAALEGRRCILIEKEPAYAKICRERVAKVLDRGLFADV